MPGPVIRDPIPEWLKPENASVFDSPLQKAIRQIASIIGANDARQQVLGMMAPMETDAAGGLVGAVQKIMKGIKAYHGSPHDFERFDISKIGTGEGAQAYGHGLYFAEQEGTAKAYRDQLAGRVPGGFAKPDSAVVHAATDLRNRGYAKADAIKALQDAYPMYTGMTFDDAWTLSNPGRMYEVNINAHPDEFLDWDNPLSQQSQKVQDATATIRRDWGMGGSPETSGQQFHRSLENDIAANAIEGVGGHPSHDAAWMLKQAGIPGIKYLDEGSRGWKLVKDPNRPGQFLGGFGSEASAQRALAELPASDLPRRVVKMPYRHEWAIEGQSGTTRNYVLFDDSLVTVLRKYGVALPVIEGLRRKAAAMNGALPESDIQSAIGTP